MVDKFKVDKITEKKIEEQLKIVNLLPEYLRTVDNKKFFDATFQQLFQQERSIQQSGYIGDKPDGYFDPNKDFYLVEKTKSRQDYQLSPIAISQNQDQETISKNFYIDIVNMLRYQGANVENHDRLFSQEYYSFSPVIDVDKLINFGNYYWIQEGPTSLNFDFVCSSSKAVNDVFVSDNNVPYQTGTKIKLISPNPLPIPFISGNEYFLINELDGFNVKLASSLSNALSNIAISFSSDISSAIIMSVITDLGSYIGLQNAVLPNGKQLTNGMKLLSFNDVNYSYRNVQLIVEGVGESILLIKDNFFGNFDGYDNSPYDEFPYDFLEQEQTVDYVTIQRGSLDGNPWSRRNRWFHKELIQNLNDPNVQPIQAKRPIIEFLRDIQLYNFGSFRRKDVDLVYTNGNIDEITGQTSFVIDGKTVRDNYRILVLNQDVAHPDRSYRIYRVIGLKDTGVISLSLETDGQNPSGEASIGDSVYIRNGDTYVGKYFHFNGNNWVESQNRLEGIPSYPLYQLYDDTGVKLDDNGLYPFSNFNGSKVFGYKINPIRPVDPFINDRVDVGTFGDLRFTNFLENEKFTFINQTSFITENIDGYYFIKHKNEYKNHWHKSDKLSRQWIRDEFIIKQKVLSNGNIEFDREYKLSQTPDSTSLGEPKNYQVKLNGNNLIDGVDYLISGDILELSLTLSLTDNDFLSVRTYSRNTPSSNITGFYEIPLNLISNPNNLFVEDIRYDQILEHYSSLLENQNGFTGNPVGNNNSRDLKLNFGRGVKILQHSAPMLKLMILNSVKDNNITQVMRFAEREYTRFYNKFLNKLESFINLGYDLSVPYIKWVTDALDQIAVGKELQSFPFAYSGMANLQKFIPPSTAYLGISPVYYPEKFLDTTLVNPINVIRLHDGQIIAAYDNIIDDVILFYENLVYDSIKNIFKKDNKEDFLSIIKEKPGYFRQTRYSKNEWTKLNGLNFVRWATKKQLNFRENTTFDDLNPWTWNYSSLKDGNGDNLPGSWRGIYLYYYDTDRPHTHPWEMLGIYEKPDWWDSTYGPAPYTSNNFLLWNDLENGVIRGGNRQGSYDYLTRNGLSNLIPVDDSGNLLTPKEIGIVLSDPDSLSSSANWNIGDMSPVEYAWYRSPSFGFSIAEVLYLTSPVRFSEYFWESDSIVRLFSNQNENQIVQGNYKNKRIPNSDLLIHGETINNEIIIKLGYQQFEYDYNKSLGKNVDSLKQLINGLDVKLGYKSGSFIENDSLRLSSESIGLIPSNNYNIDLQFSSSIKELIYSGVVVVKNEDSFSIFGYDNVNNNFNILSPVTSSGSFTVNFGGKQPVVSDWQSGVFYIVGSYVKVGFTFYRCVIEHTSSDNFSIDNNKWVELKQLPIIGGISSLIYNQYNGNKSISYGTELFTIQDVTDFLMGYQNYLISKGWIFDKTDENGQYQDFQLSVLSFLEWLSSSPQIGDAIVLSPLSNYVKLFIPQGYVDSLSELINGSYSLLDVSGNIIKTTDINVSRDGNEFKLTLKENKTNQKFHLIRLNVVEVEHCLIFNNLTDFEDIIYEPLLSLKQPRIKFTGTVTEFWNGRFEAEGFIINRNGMTANIEKSVDDFRKFYDREQLLLTGNLNEAAKKLVGFGERDYLSNLLMDSRDQFNFYQGMIREKGSYNGFNKILRNDFLKESLDLQIFEEWAVRVGRYGATESESTIEIKLIQDQFKSNTQVVRFVNTDNDDEFDDTIDIGPNDSRFILKRLENTTTDQFVTGFLRTKLPTAGYALTTEANILVPREDSIDGFMKSYLSLNEISQYQRLWIANNFKSSWSMFSLDKIAEIDSIEKGLTENDPFVINFNSPVSVSVPNIIHVCLSKNISKNIGIYKINIDASRNFALVYDYNGNIVTLEEETFSSEKPEVFQLINVRFDTVSDFSSSTHIPIGGWNNSNDLIFIDNYNLTNRFSILKPDLSIIRTQEEQVDTNLFDKVLVYDSKTDKTNIILSVYNPIQGNIPLSIEKNINIKLDYDPAKYNIAPEGDLNLDPDNAWEFEKVGQIWWNLDSVRFLNYDQSDDNYKVSNWGNVFPGTEIEILEWVKSPVHPSLWQEFVNDVGRTQFSVNSYPKYIDKYVISKEYSYARGAFVDVYYFWLRNNDNINPASNNSMSAFDIQQTLSNINASGIAWFSPIGKSKFILVNTNQHLSDVTILQINFKNFYTDNNIHTEWVLLREFDDVNPPNNLVWQKMKDSISGLNAILEPVPDVNLQDSLKYGNFYRPRQSWYRDLKSARLNFVTTANKILSEFNWVENTVDWDVNLIKKEEYQDYPYDYLVPNLSSRDSLIGNTGFIAGKIVTVEVDSTLGGRWSRWSFNGVGFDFINSQLYRTEDFWSKTDWYASGYSKSTRINSTYSTILDRNLGNNIVGDIVKVLDDGSGRWALYLLTKSNTWSLIGQEEGTILLKSNLYDFSDSYEQSASPRSWINIIDAIYNQLSTTREKNRYLISNIREATRQFISLDWVFKTSFGYGVGLSDTLAARAILQPDLAPNVINYFNEVKPYHVKLRTLLEKKDAGTDEVNVLLEGKHDILVKILFDRVSHDYDLSKPQDQWKAAERIAFIGKDPKVEISRYEYAGQVYDGQFFKYFEPITGAGYDMSPYDSVLGYDYDVSALMNLYDVELNNADFTPSLPVTSSSLTVDGSDFIQPLLTEKRPPEFVPLKVGDTLDIEVYTLPMSDNIPNKKGGRPKILQTYYKSDGFTTSYDIGQQIQKRDAVHVFLDGIMLNYGNLSNEYTIDYENNQVEFNIAPSLNSYIKIVSFSVGGKIRKKEKLFKNATGTTFDMKINIEVTDSIYCTINGIVTTSLSYSGSVVTVPSVTIGDEVFIVVFQNAGYSENYLQNESFSTNPIVISNPSLPDVPEITQTIIYKNNKRIKPPYIRYFDIKIATSTLFIKEKIHTLNSISVWKNGIQMTPVIDFNINMNSNSISLVSPAIVGDSIIVINSYESEYDINSNNLEIYSIASGSNVVSNISEGSSIDIDSTVINFTRPDSVGNIPIDENSSDFVIDGSVIFDPSVSIGSSHVITINSQNINVLSTDTIIDVNNKINSSSGLSGVSSNLVNVGNKFRLNFSSGSFVKGDIINPVFTIGQTFNINSTPIITTGSSLIDIINDINDASITNIVAYTNDGFLIIEETSGGTINISGIPFINESGIFIQSDYIGSVPSPTVSIGDSITINGIITTFTGTTLTDVINDINASSIFNVITEQFGAAIRIRSVDGSHVYISGTGTALSDLGISVTTSVNITPSSFSLSNNWSILGITNGTYSNYSLLGTLDFPKNTPLSITGTLTINSTNIIVNLSDTIETILDKINNVSSITNVTSSVISSEEVIQLISFSGQSGKNITLSGSWSIYGITNGSYNNVVTILRQNLGAGYKVYSCNQKLKIIKLDGSDIQCTPSGIPDMVSIFGLPSITTINGDSIKIYSFDSNSTLSMKTEVLEGNSTKQYPLTAKGYDTQSILVSYNGDEMLFKSDYDIKTVSDGYDIYRYDTVGYDGTENIGIEFGDNYNHNSCDWIAITTFNSVSTDVPVGFRVFKNIMNIWNYSRISDSNSTELVQPLLPTDTQIVVKDATVLSLPTGDTPGVIFVAAERIEFWQVDTSIPGQHVLSNILRGTQGTPYGYTVNGINIPAGTTVRDASANQNFPIVPDSYNVIFAPDGIQKSNNIIAKFLKKKPGTYGFVPD